MCKAARLTIYSIMTMHHLEYSTSPVFTGVQGFIHHISPSEVNPHLASSFLEGSDQAKGTA